MKRVPIVLAVLLLASAVVVAQNKNSGNKNTKRAKPIAAAADCSKMTDAEITAAVKEKFGKTPSLKDAGINVATSGGTVTLTGTVKTSNVKGVATRQAKSIACVKKVENKCEAEAKSVAPIKNSNAKPKNSNAKPKNSNAKPKSSTSKTKNS